MLHVLIGAAVGALVGGAASAIGSLVKGEPISWKKVAAGAVGGAATGAIASLTFGAGLLAGSAVGEVSGMVAAGAAGGATETVTDNVLHDRKWHEDVAENAAIGAAVGGVLGGARVAAKPLVSVVRNNATRLMSAGRGLLNDAKPIVRRLARSATKPASRNARRLIKPISDLARRQADRLLKPVIDQARRRVLGPLARRLEPVLRPLEPVLKPMGRVWKGYRRLLDTKPIRTKAATSAGISMTGDVIAQATDKSHEPWDWRRTAFRGAFAALWSAPMGHYWFNALDKVIPGNAWGSVLAKIGADQLLWAPVSGSVFFGTYSMAVDGMTPGEAVDRVKRDLPRALKAQYAVWPAVHLINFRAVPLNMRVPFSSSVGLGWSVFFSTMLSSDDEEPQAQAADVKRIDAALGDPRDLPPVDDPVVASARLDAVRQLQHQGATATSSYFGGLEQSYGHQASADTGLGFIESMKRLSQH